MISDYSKPAADERATSRIFGLAEVLFLLVGFAVVAREIAPLLGVATRETRNALLFGNEAPQWLEAAQAEAGWLALRFGGMLVAAWAFCVWRRGPDRREAALSFGNQSFGSLIATGLGVCVVMLAPWHAVWAVHLVHPLGEDTDIWALVQRSPWSMDFWIYMAVSSVLVVPVVEELFFRGYALGRFRENFSVGGAVVLSAALFWIAHGQYLSGDGFLLFHSLYAFFGATVLGWVTVRTGSLLPAFVGHICLNVPGNLGFHLAWIGVAAVVIIVWRKSLVRLSADYLKLLVSTREWGFLVILVAFVSALIFLIRSQQHLILPVAGAFLLLALASLVRRRTRQKQIDETRSARD